MLSFRLHVLFGIFLIMLFGCSVAFSQTDLENFKTQRRSPVRVREGQGVVLLCGPPPHSGGKLFFFFLTLMVFLCDKLLKITDLYQICLRWLYCYCVFFLFFIVGVCGGTLYCAIPFSVLAKKILWGWEEKWK